MEERNVTRVYERLGPGLITGAADDDPSGIATYSQAGAQFGFGLVWTLFLTTPLMIGIQMLSARIGWATGEGLTTNIGRLCPRWLTVSLVSLLVVANTINIAADIGAMGEAVRILIGGKHAVYVIGFGALCIATQVFFSYERIVRILKWLTLGLFAYVAVVLSVAVPWRQAISQSFQPWAHIPANVPLGAYAAMIVAVLGT
ncbi:MAG: divalent metal cation transporter, partial [Sulfuricaulis sp.]|nr:divalent metal cation transporter [Sulfuricaulis sp.]